METSSFPQLRDDDSVARGNPSTPLGCRALLVSHSSSYPSMTMFLGGAIAAVGGGSNIIIGVFIAACSSVRFLYFMIEVGSDGRQWYHAYLTLSTHWLNEWTSNVFFTGYVKKPGTARQTCDFLIFFCFLSVLFFTQANGTIITYIFITCRINTSFFVRFIFHSGGV
jgi:hypothetical protein